MPGARAIPCPVLFVLPQATLANAGICPTSGARVFEAGVVRNCLSTMLSCGQGEFSGEYAFHIGLPSKTGLWPCYHAPEQKRDSVPEIGVEEELLIEHSKFLMKCFQCSLLYATQIQGSYIGGNDAGHPGGRGHVYLVTKTCERQRDALARQRVREGRGLRAALHQVLQRASVRKPCQ